VAAIGIPISLNQVAAVFLTTYHKITHRRHLVAGIMLCIVLCFCVTVYARPSDKDVRLISAGLDLFSSFLAADLGIASKSDTDGRLLLVLVYRDDELRAGVLVERLKWIDTIRGISVRIQLLAVSDLETLNIDVPAGIFISQRLDDQNLHSVIQYSIQHKVLLFSPFASDVNKGVATGISVTDRILPYINVKSVHESGIRLKPFFLKIAKRYE